MTGFTGRMREVVDELEGTRKLLFDSVLSLPQASLDFPPSADRWSLGEILHHLRLLEDGAVRVTAPASVAPQKGISARELLEGLAGSRALFMKALEKCARFDFTEVRFPHPVLGNLNGYQWALYVAKHEERHRRQIEKVKALRADPS